MSQHVERVDGGKASAPQGHQTPSSPNQKQRPHDVARGAGDRLRDRKRPEFHADEMLVILAGAKQDSVDRHREEDRLVEPSVLVETVWIRPAIGA